MTNQLNLTAAVATLVATPEPLTLVTVNEPAPGTATRLPTLEPEVSIWRKTLLVAVTVELVITALEAPIAMAERPEGLLMVAAPGGGA